MLLSVILLALIQGLTEFLPVSSSGHLTVAQYFLPSFDEPDLLLDVWLHLGTLFATLFAFRHKLLHLTRSLWEKSRVQDRKMIGLLIVGSVPTAVIGLVFKEQLERAFDTPWAVGMDLILTGLILAAAAQFSKNQKKTRDITILIALAIGLVQGFAIMPGISRSGSTIAMAMLLGVQASVAAEFSFLLSLPAIAGALVLQSRDLIGQPGQTEPYLLVIGMVLAMVSGYLALRWFLKLVARGKLLPFAIYCMLLGSFFLLWVLTAGS